MNPNFVGSDRGRCASSGYSQNELRFSAFVKEPNPFKPTEPEDPKETLSELQNRFPNDKLKGKNSMFHSQLLSLLRVT